MPKRNLTADQQAMLTAEIQNDPEARGYGAMGGEGPVLQDLRAARYPGECRCTILTIAGQLGSGVARRLASSMQALAASDALVTEMLALSRSAVGIDLNHADARQLIDAMARNGDLELTAEDAAAIRGLTDDRASRLDLLGLPVPRLREVREALQ